MTSHSADPLTLADFSSNRWADVLADYDAWWSGSLQRPLLAITVAGGEPHRPPPAFAARDFTSFFEESISADDVVDTWDYSLAAERYYGDAIPHVMPNFGPGVTAAFMGCRLVNGDTTVWFEPPEPPPALQDLHITPTPDSPWLSRIADLYHAALRRWNGRVQLDMTDLGGNLDIVAAFRTTNQLLLDLYDSPADVKRLTWEAHHGWWHYYEQLNRILQPHNPGYTGWIPVLSSTPYYNLQCDFAYMLGPDMFDEFVKPELIATCKRLGRKIYHLDGVGQLPHLDSLLAIPELDAIQWVMGENRPDAEHWIHVYRKILDAGKRMQISCGHANVGFRIIDVLKRELGTTRGIILTGRARPREEQELRDVIQRHR